MTKLKNTTENKLKLTGALAGGGALILIALFGRDKKSVLASAGIGAAIGLFITTGVMSWVIEDAPVTAQLSASYKATGKSS